MSYKKLEPTDAEFRFSPDGMTLVPRAGFEILQTCPREYRLVISECLERGWLKPVAFMRDAEYTWERLQS